MEIPLLLHAPAAVEDQPVSVGVPLPRGSRMGDFPLRLLTADGRRVSLQTEPLARWPDGSVRWLLLDFVIPRLTAGDHRWSLTGGSRSDESSAPRLNVRDAERTVVVETGAVRFHVDREFLRPLLAVQGEGFRLTEPVTLLDMQTSNWSQEPGQAIRSPAVEKVELHSGPIRATITLRGAGYSGGCRLVARVSFFAVPGLVRFDLTAHNPSAARHPGGLWDLGDRGSAQVASLAMGLPLFGMGFDKVRYVLEPGQEVRETSEKALEIYQASSGGDNWLSRVHSDRHGNVPWVFQGYRVQVDGREFKGGRASPVVTVQDANLAVTAALPEFWQQFPRRLRVGDRGLVVGFWPWEPGYSHELQGGEQKTHTLWLHFGPPTAGDRLPLEWVHRPVVVRPAPEWVAAAGVFPHLPMGRDERLDSLLDTVVEGPSSFFAGRETIDEYGWRHFGEVYADHENEHSSAAKPVVSHYNNQYDVIYGLLLEYLRRGDPRWFDLLDTLARHVADIDVYHTRRDRSAYSGGLFWHTDHYQDAATCTHRAYSKANANPGQPYGGGPSCEHNYTTGLLHHHYLTGSPQSREALLELADWVLRMDDGSRNVMGVIDDGPTGLASCTRHPDYHGPGRGAGNSTNALLDAWLLTGGRHYLEYAETLIRRCIHPADDVAARDLLNVEDRWSYTVFLSVLCRYLDLKADAGERDFSYAYARAALLHYASWMEQNERPYFDRPEQLEYPTETWAAQELRKGNVLRLAARYAAEPVCGKLWQRGEELAERAWSDLLRFESRFWARPRALAMREGLVDVALRRQGIPPPEPTPEAHDFGQPEAFVPQKQRVKRMLKSPGGLALACLRVLHPGRWARYLARGKR